MLKIKGSRNTQKKRFKKYSKEKAQKILKRKGSRGIGAYMFVYW